jgi:hypothetical protein
MTVRISDRNEISLFDGDDMKCTCTQLHQYQKGESTLWSSASAAFSPVSIDDDDDADNSTCDGEDEIQQHRQHRICIFQFPSDWENSPTISQRANAMWSKSIIASSSSTISSLSSDESDTGYTTTTRPPKPMSWIEKSEGHKKRLVEYTSALSPARKFRRLFRCRR